MPKSAADGFDRDDPAGQGVDAVRPIRDQIRARIEKLAADLTT